MYTMHGHIVETLHGANYAFKIAYIALEQCSKIKPVMLRNSNYAHWYCEIQHFKFVFNLNFIDFLLIMYAIC